MQGIICSFFNSLNLFRDVFPVFRNNFHIHVSEERKEQERINVHMRSRSKMETGKRALQCLISSIKIYTRCVIVEHKLTTIKRFVQEKMKTNRAANCKTKRNEKIANGLSCISRYREYRPCFRDRDLHFSTDGIFAYFFNIRGKWNETTEYYDENSNILLLFFYSKGRSLTCRLFCNRSEE